jgi:hypothetical protein
MFYYVVNRLPFAFGVLILVLPFLSRNKTYRTATLFAALNAGIISILFFTDILSSEPSFIDTESIAYFSFLMLPALYLTSLLLGATIIAHGTLNATKLLRAVLVVMGGAILCAYLTPLLFKAFLSLLDGMPASRLIRILRPEIGHETVALAISTAASAVITILIMRASENRNCGEPAEVDTPAN